MRIYGGVRRSEESITRIKQYSRHRYHNDKARLLAQQKQHRATPRFKKKHAAIEREKRLQDRVRLLMLLGGHCRWCGINDMRVLQVDHVNGNGRKTDQRRSSDYMLKRVFERPENYQLLCSNCNWVKRYENNETANKFARTA